MTAKFSFAKYINEKGFAPLLLIMFAVGIISVLLLASITPIKSRFFSDPLGNADAAEQVNLLTNSSFETVGSGNWPSNWQSRPSFSLDTTVTQDGLNSIKMVNATASANVVYTFQKIKIQPNKNYTLSFYGKSGGINGKGLRARFVAVSPQTITFQTPNITGAIGSWTQQSITFTTPNTYVPSDSDRVDLIAEFNPNDIGWVDNIALVDNTVTPTAIPSPTPVAYTPFSLPDPDLNNGPDIEAWWASHPLNAQSANYKPTVVSPPNQINVLTQFNGDLQAALNSLDPQTGGTLILEPKPNNEPYGFFSVIGKSNIHFIGQAVNGVLPTLRRGDILGCEEAKNVKSFQLGIENRTPAFQNCFESPKTNFYFKDIVFDGGYPQLPAVDAAMYAVKMRSIKHVLFDNVIVRNYLDYSVAINALAPDVYKAKIGDDPAVHYGIIWGNGGTNNTWCRKCRFEGSQRYGFFLDGPRGSGVIDSWFNQAKLGSGGLLYLTNDDFTFDLNNNGVFEHSDKRNAQYNVVVNNTFTGTSSGNSVSIMGRQILIKGNTHESTGAPFFAQFSVKCSGKLARTKGVVYENYDDKVIGNVLASSNTVAKWNSIDGIIAGACISKTNPLDPSLYGKLGRFTVKDNIVKKPLISNGNAFTWAGYDENRVIDGVAYENKTSIPNTIENNCSGPTCN